MLTIQADKIMEEHAASCKKCRDGEGTCQVMRTLFAQYLVTLAEGEKIGTEPGVQAFMTSAGIA